MFRKRPSTDRRIGQRDARRGFVVISVVVLLTVVAALFGLWAKAAVSEHRQLEYRQHELQAIRLAEAGVGRGMARRASDPVYDGETWTIPAADLGQSHAAEVTIRVVTAAADAATLQIEATANYPAGGPSKADRARHTKQIEIPTPSPSEENES